MMSIEDVERMIGNAFPDMYVFVDKNDEIVVCLGVEVKR